MKNNLFMSLLLGAGICFFSGPALSSAIPPQSVCAIEGEVIWVGDSVKWVAAWGQDGSFISQHHQVPVRKVEIRVQSSSVLKAEEANICDSIKPGMEQPYELCTGDIELSVGDHIKGTTQLRGDEFAISNCLISATHKPVTK